MSTEYGAYVGIDWASDKHDILCRMGQLESHTVLPHDGGKIRRYFAELSAKTDGKPIAVCLEQARGSLMNVLREVPNTVLLPVNPATLVRFRRAFTPSYAKNDVTDAAYACDIVQSHAKKVRAAPAFDEQTEALDVVTRARRDAVDDRTRLGQKLTETLKSYFPQCLEIFEDITAVIVLAFLEKYPTLNHVHRESDAELIAFLRRHHSTKESLNQQRIELLRNSESHIKNERITDCYVLAVNRLVRELRSIHEGIAAFDKELKKQVVAHPDYAIFSSLPGAGTVHAARLITDFGTDRTRFKCAQDSANCFGVTPILIQSGKTNIVAARVAKSHYIHQSIVEWASGTISKCAWAKDYYSKKRAKGSKHRVAVRALAFKWIRILFKCWADRKPYDEAKYLKAISKIKS